MDPSFLGIAVSRKDGSNADGIHLLWTAPYATGYSVEGFDIQRRLSRYKPRIDCYTLTPSDLGVLHRDYRVETPIALVGVRQAACPDFPRDPPDEPYKGAEHQPGADQTCADFQSFPTRSGANPLAEKGASFLVRDHNGLVKPQTNITALGGFKGLDCGATLEINLPLAVLEVELTLVHFSSPARIEAFESDGSSAATVSTNSQQHVAQTFKLSGTAINRRKRCCSNFALPRRPPSASITNPCRLVLRIIPATREEFFLKCGATQAA
jgi:hypothetical protein